jgi:manganese/zinc/iron transport system substrate-binding protein
MLCGCSGSNEHVRNFEAWMQPNGKIKVLSTTAMIDDLVGQVGGERVDRLSLIVGEVDPHSYELIKGDDEKLAFATVIFTNGLGLEHGASLRARLQKRSAVVALGDELQKRYPELILHAGKAIDPHIWMDISLWMKTVDPIVETLTLADPEGKEVYERNGEALKAQMQQAHEQMLEQMHKIPASKRFLVTSHDAFNYFARAYLAESNETSQAEWQKRFAAPEGLAPDGQLSVADIQNIIKHLAQYKIEVIFPESNVSKDSLRKIVNACASKGLKVILSQSVLYADSMGSLDSGAGTYLKMIEHNVKVLQDAWQ